MADDNPFKKFEELSDVVEQNVALDQIIYIESMRELGFIDKNGRPDYHKLDNKDNAKKLGELIETKRGNHFEELYSKPLETLDHQQLFQYRFGENVGDASRNALQQGKNYTLSAVQQRMNEQGRQQRQQASLYAAKDVTSVEDVKKALGPIVDNYDLPKELQPREAQQIVSTAVANDNKKQLYDQILSQYRKN